MTERLSLSLMPLCPRCYLNSLGYLLFQAGSEGSPSREHPSTQRTLLFFPREHSPAPGALFAPDLPLADTKANGHGSPFCPPPPSTLTGLQVSPPTKPHRVCLPSPPPHKLQLPQGATTLTNCPQSPEHFLGSGSAKGAAINSVHYPQAAGERDPPSTRGHPRLKEKTRPEVWKVSGPRSDSWVCPKPLINNSVSVLCLPRKKQRTSLLDSWFDLQRLNSLIWIHGRNISFPLGAQGESESLRVPDLQKLAGREESAGKQGRVTLASAGI